MIHLGNGAFIMVIVIELVPLEKSGRKKVYTRLHNFEDINITIIIIASLH